MNEFKKRAAIRIATVSLVLAAVTSPAAWFVARERSEESVVSLAMEESRRLIAHQHDALPAGASATSIATNAAKAITGGLFDIAEIYDAQGNKLAESMTASGSALESAMPKHVAPTYTKPFYSSFNLGDSVWALRVFVPLRASAPSADQSVTGYFEGVRIVPDWEKDQIFRDALTVALMVCLASLASGAALYPVVVYLAADNERKSYALIDGLKRSEQELEGKVAQRTDELQQAKKRTTALLHNILPAELADELVATGSARPARHESATILFTDFSGFTHAASSMPADRVVTELNEIFAAFDDITDDCGVEKIKTIGDAYMAAAGLPKPCADHAQRCVRAGLRMVAFMEERNRTATFKWSVRVGVHSGPVVSGVVGKRKYAFDIWGDTVNIASRMESSGAVGRVNASAYTYDMIRNEFECEYRGKIDAKGKGEMDMYFVTRAPPTLASV
jgi:class 3 adenylate cyclase